jgi:hypothetical protein
VSVLFLLFSDFINLKRNRQLIIIRSIWTLTALAPGSIMYFLYWRYRVGVGPSKAEWPSIRYPLSNLFTLAPISAFGGPERIFAVAVLLLIVTAMIASIVVAVRRKIAIEWRYLGLSMVLTVILFIAPTSATGGTMITPRLVYFPIFVISLVIPLYLGNNAWRVAAAAVSVTVAIALLILRVPKESRYNTQIKQLLHSIPATSRGGSLLFLTAKRSGDGESFMDFITYNESVGGYLAVERGLVLVNNYEANTDYFPFLYKVNRDPYPMLVAASGIPGCSAMRDYEKISGRSVDYVVILQRGNTENDSHPDYSRCGYSLMGNPTGPYKARIYAASK